MSSTLGMVAATDGDLFETTHREQRRWRECPCPSYSNCHRRDPRGRHVLASSVVEAPPSALVRRASSGADASARSACRNEWRWTSVLPHWLPRVHGEQGDDVETTIINLSSMMALQRKLDVAANNVANLETTGFRAQQVSFQEYLSPMMGHEPGGERERPVSLVHALSTFTQSTPGAIRPTGNPLDFAIDGDAYFAVQTDQGERYTRDGSFTLDGQGRLVTLLGYPVMADKGVLTIPPNVGKISVDSSGQISTERGILGRLRLVSFSKQTSLQSDGRNLLQSDLPPGGDKAVTAKILQGALEHSNVQATFEIAKLGELNRAYETASKLLKDTLSADDLNKLAEVPESKGR